MNKMLRFALITFSLLLSPNGYSWDDLPEEPETHRYYLPFVESTFSGDWQFRLEMATIGSEPFEVTIIGVGHRGARLFEETTTHEPEKVVVWESNPDQGKQRLQSLIVVSDSELTGVLWMENEEDRLYNAVAMVADNSGDRLVLTHIPDDRYNWETNAAVIGVDAGQVSSSLEFEYTNDQGFRRSSTLRTTFDEGAWYSGSPYHKIPIGTSEEEDVAPWGAVYTGSSDFHLAGVQNYVRYSENQLLSCAVALQPGPGRTSGMIGISNHEAMGFSNWLAFTNPNDVPVALTLTLSYLPDETIGEKEEGEEKSEPATKRVHESLILAPRTRSLHVLFGDLFREVAGTPYILSYTSEALADPEDVAAATALPIHALLLQADSAVTVLGASHFTDTVGRLGQTWIDLNSNELAIDIFNPGSLRTQVMVALTDVKGNRVVFSERIPLEPGAGYYGLSTSSVRQFLIDTDQEEALDTGSPLRVTVSLQRGDGIFTKLTGFSRDEDGTITDIAIVGGSVNTPAIENPPF